MYRFLMYHPSAEGGEAESQTGDVGTAPEGAADQNQLPEPPQQKEKDPEKAFAARLGHEKKKLLSEYGPYKSVIERQAKAAGMEPGEYLKYVQEQQDREELEVEAAKTGKTPEQLKVEKEKADAEARLAEMERKQKLTDEEKALVSDPKIGKFVSDNLADIKEIAEAAGTDLRTAMLVVAGEKLPELIEKADPEKMKDAIIKDYLESLKKGAKPVEIGGGAASVGNSAPKTFDDAKKNAIEMLKAANTS